MATLRNQLVHTNASIQLIVNGVVIGYATNCTGAEEFGTQPVPKGIGSIMPAEHVYTQWAGNVTVSKFFLRKEQVKSAGYAGSAERILNQDVIDIKFIDKVTGKNIITFVGCTIGNKNFNVTNNGIVGRDATFFALDIINSEEE